MTRIIFRYIIFILSVVFTSCGEKEKEYSSFLENEPRKICADPVDDPLEKLEDQAKQRGVDINIPFYSERAECNYIPGGVVAQDLNNDGWVDLLFNKVDGSPWAFQNQQGQFQELELQLELFDESRVNLGLAAVDLNGDSLPEIVQSGAGFAVYAENLGNFQFGEWQVILNEPEYPRTCYNSFNFGDFDQDNDLDLALAGLDQTQEEGQLVGFNFNEWYAGFDILIENRGDSWTKIKELSSGGSLPSLSILQAFTDMDNDGDLDLISASDRPLEGVFPPMAFWINQGVVDGELQLEDIAQDSGANMMIGVMGLGANDLNQDGLLDYCMTDLKNILICYMSDGIGTYYDAGAALGLIVNVEDHPRLPIWWQEQLVYTDTTWSGWSLILEDLDNDGYLDMASTAGAPPDGGSVPYSAVDQFQPDWIWKGGADGFQTFDPSHSFYSEDPHYGMASADLDHDGYRELIVGPAYGRPFIFNNPCGRGNWLEIDLIGKGNNKEAFGAKVVIDRGHFVDQQEVHNLLSMGQGPSELHFGLGALDTVDSITVHWVDGTETVLENVTTNQFLEIRQE